MGVPSGNAIHTTPASGNTLNGMNRDVADDMASIPGSDSGSDVDEPAMTHNNDIHHDGSDFSENGLDAIDHADSRAPNAPSPSVVRYRLQKLNDAAGDMPPTIHSRTRQQAHGMGECLVMKMTISKKQRRFRRKLEAQLLKRSETETKKKLRNKQKNLRRKLRLQLRQKEDEAHPHASGHYTIPTDGSDASSVSHDPHEHITTEDLRHQLQAQRKPGVSFPQDSCSSKNLTNELEAFALTQYSLKRGLKEFGSDGIVALGKEMEQLHTRKVAKPVDGSMLTAEQK